MSRTTRLLAGVAVLATAGSIGVLAADTPRRTATPDQPVVAAPRQVTWEPSAGASRAGAAPPVRVRIPALAVDSELVDLVVDRAGAIIPPRSPHLIGWFTAGPAPGDIGPAVLAGHVDSRTGPGVFFGLSGLRPGARVQVDRADGSTVTFAVAGVARMAKAAFPTELVYAPAPGPELRLVTCGGSFDRSRRSYRDNIVVQAVLEADGRQGGAGR